MDLTIPLHKIRSFAYIILLVGASVALSSCIALETVTEPDYPVTVQRDVPSPVNYPVPRPPITRSFRTHTVAPGETLWRIAKVYDVPQSSIMRINRIQNDSDLQMGDKLSIPDAKDPKQILSLFPSDKWKYIIIHHSATNEGSSLQFNEYHLAKGWNGVGYHFVVDNGKSNKPDGFIEITPRWLNQENGAHCKAADMNIKGIGICLVGSFNESGPTKAQMESLIYLVKKLREYYKIPVGRVLRHGEVSGSNTECPGGRFPWRQFKRKL